MAHTFWVQSIQAIQISCVGVLTEPNLKSKSFQRVSQGVWEARRDSKVTPSSKDREIAVRAVVSLATGGPAVVAIFSAPTTAVQVKCSGGWRCVAVSDNTGI